MTEIEVAPLSQDEKALWHAVKNLGEAALMAVARDLDAATGLSGADFAILSRIDELGDGTLRQADLLVSLRWQKSRLSHQLTRMEQRDLLRRETSVAGRGPTVRLLPNGREAIRRARPVHAAAVRKHVIGQITTEEADAIIRVVARLEGVRMD